MFSKEALENYLKIKIKGVFYKKYVSQQGGGVVGVGTKNLHSCKFCVYVKGYQLD